MMSPKFSIIIPEYNNAEYLADAIQSVLDQTYENFEIIVINDASPDDPSQIISQFKDARIRYIIHDKNKGLAATRNTGIRLSTGDYIALLDGDDYFHPEKLRLHAEFYEKHPDIGVTYNARFNLNHSSKTIRGLWRPPLSVSLADLILGFPFSPSDMVIRRDWAFEVNLFDEKYTYFGEDIDINCRLALDGCKFASVDRALNYRRFHSDRIIKNLREYQEYELLPVSQIFADPRCPAEVLSLREIALSNRYLGWTNTAFDQNETALGQEYCRKAVELNPAILTGFPNPLTESFLMFSILDENRDHAELLPRMFHQLPPEISLSKEQATGVIARGFLHKGARAVIWGRVDAGRTYFQKAKESNAIFDEIFIHQLTNQVIDYEMEFGENAGYKVLNELLDSIDRIGDRKTLRLIKGIYSFNRAMRDYQSKRYNLALRESINAIINEPEYITNRGIVTTLGKSVFHVIGIYE